MNKFKFFENSDSSDDSDMDDPSAQEIQCKNIDSALAKLLGIIVQEHQPNTDWKPPTHSGLSNSERIIPSAVTFNPSQKENQVFRKIKDDIVNYKNLSNEQLDYIRNTNEREKFEIIEIYNRLTRMQRK